MSASEGEEPQHMALILLPKWPGTQREVGVFCGSQLVCIGCLATPIRGEREAIAGSRSSQKCRGTVPQTPRQGANQLGSVGMGVVCVLLSNSRCFLVSVYGVHAALPTESTDTEY